MGILEEILHKQNQIIEMLQQRSGLAVGTSDPEALLGAKEICETIGISTSTLKRNVPELAKFGLNKVDGRWKMKRKDLFFYVNSKVKS